MLTPSPAPSIVKTGLRLKRPVTSFELVNELSVEGFTPPKLDESVTSAHMLPTTGANTCGSRRSKDVIRNAATLVAVVQFAPHPASGGGIPSGDGAVPVVPLHNTVLCWISSGSSEPF